MLEHVTVSLLAEGHILVEDYPGVGKTALARALSRSIDCAVRARAVHGRPAAGRHRRLADLQPARGALRVPPGPDLRQRRARRRGQPRLAEDAVGPAGVHAGAPRHRRRAPRTSSRARSWSSPPRTPSSTRAPTRCPRRRSTASWSGSRSATPTPTAEAGMLLGHESRDKRARARAGRRPRRDRRGRRDRAPRARLAGAARLHRRAAAAHARGRPRRARRLAARRA